MLSILLFLFINLLSLPDHKIRETQVHVVPHPPLFAGHGFRVRLGLIPASLPFLWRSLTQQTALAADIQEGVQLGWTPACEDRAAWRRVSAPGGSALGGEKSRGCCGLGGGPHYPYLCRWAGPRLCMSTPCLCGLGVAGLPCPPLESECNPQRREGTPTATQMHLPAGTHSKCQTRALSREGTPQGALHTPRVTEAGPGPGPGLHLLIRSVLFWLKPSSSLYSKASYKWSDAGSGAGAFPMTSSGPAEMSGRGTGPSDANGPVSTLA